MSKVTLSENQTVTLPARGMFHVEAYPLGVKHSPVRLELLGEVRSNRVSDSAVRLLSGQGEVEIRLSPQRGMEFEPGTAVQVHLTRGRPGTPQETGAEFPVMALDGRRATVVGMLRYEGDTVVIAAQEGVAAHETRFDGIAATVREGLRALINRRYLYSPHEAAAPVELRIDTSASMAAQVTERELAAATDLVLGAVGAIKPGSRYRVSSDLNPRGVLLEGLMEIRRHVHQEVEAGVNHIGSGVERAPGRPGWPSFALSDEEPALCPPYGLTVVLGAGVRARFDPVGTYGVLRLTEEVLAALEGNDARVLDFLYEHIVRSCYSDPPSEDA